ncbi:hypothetical protein BUH_1465 [Burkholderia pseudomallei Pakistan 9]|nr:hypothetical protein BUH_1465 [Burkholderia pseudomallei Pakistan 9]
MVSSPASAAGSDDSISRSFMRLLLGCCSTSYRRARTRA